MIENNTREQMIKKINFKASHILYLKNWYMFHIYILWLLNNHTDILHWSVDLVLIAL